MCHIHRISPCSVTKFWLIGLPPSVRLGPRSFPRVPMSAMLTLSDLYAKWQCPDPNCYRLMNHWRYRCRCGWMNEERRDAMHRWGIPTHRGRHAHSPWDSWRGPTLNHNSTIDVMSDDAEENGRTRASSTDPPAEPPTLPSLVDVHVPEVRSHQGTQTHISGELELWAPTLCRFCTSHNAVFACNPCGHLIMCTECAIDGTRPDIHVCPICRARVVTLFRIWFT